MQVRSGKDWKTGEATAVVTVNKAEVARARARTAELAETEALRAVWGRVGKSTPHGDSLRPQDLSLSVDQSLQSESMYVETEPDPRDLSFDTLLQKTLLAKKLHKTLAEVSENRASLHKKAVSRSDLGLSRKGFESANRSFVLKRVSPDAGKEPVSTRFLANISPKPLHRSYRSLADARFEAKSRLKAVGAGV